MSPSKISRTAKSKKSSRTAKSKKSNRTAKSKKSHRKAKSKKSHRKAKSKKSNRTAKGGFLFFNKSPSLVNKNSDFSDSSDISNSINISISNIFEDNRYAFLPYIPDYKIVNDPAFAQVKFNLRNKQSIIVTRGHMMTVDSHVDITTDTKGGLFKGYMRSLLTNASMFMTVYTGTQHTNQVCCSSFLPGDILPLIIKPGETFRIKHTSLICYTENLELGTNSKFKNIMVSEGIFSLNLSNTSNKDGCAWLGAYGGYDSKTIKKHEAFKLDNGLFLASNIDTDYSISKAGNIKTSILSGEGFLMEFKDPCTVYYTGRNINKFEHFIANIVAKYSSNTNIMKDVLYTSLKNSFDFKK